MVDIYKIYSGDYSKEGYAIKKKKIEKDEKKY